MALSWVIGALPFSILKGSMLQGEGDHVLGQEETESEVQKAQGPESAAKQTRAQHSRCRCTWAGRRRCHTHTGGMRCTAVGSG